MGNDSRIVKLIALLGAALLTLAACGSTEGETDTSNQGDQGDSGAETGVVPTIEEGVLTVGSDIPYPPFEFRKEGELQGLDIDLIREIAARLELELPEDRIVDTNFNTIFTQLAGGRYDVVIAASTITAKREEQVNFSDPYYKSQQSVTVESGSDITGIEDLSEGDVVGVQNGTTGKAYAEDNVPEGVEVRSFPQGPDGYTALEAGQVDAVINDEPTAIAEIAARGDSLELVQTIDTGEAYGIAVDPNNKELLEAINEALAEIIEDGTYAEIYNRYPDLPPGGKIAES